MKPTINTLIISAISSIGILCSGCQNNTEETAEDEAAAAEISNHLDLEVVISLFGESENLEDFESKLNDPERQISNLDLNEDDEIDYLRVVESSMDETHLVSVQAVIGEDQYQDVATFDVERTEQGKAQVHLVGDPYVYGPNYVIQPTFVRAPLIFAWFWSASYRNWLSPYYWGHYPPHYHSWHPHSYTVYRKNVTHHHNSKHVYHYGSYERNKNSITLYNKSKRNDYGFKHPSKSFAKRNKGIENRYKLDEKRGKANIKVADNKKPETPRKYAPKPSKPATRPTLPAAKPTKPAARPTKPTARPTKPAAKPTKPAARPTKPAARPTKPIARPTKPAARPSKPAQKRKRK